MKPFIVFLLLTFSLTTQAAGSVQFQTNFLVRGHTQTNEKPAVQASLSKNFSNIYIGAWGSNIGFDGGLELDAFAGITWKYFDIGILHHNYPNQPDRELTSNFTEAYVKATFKGMTLGWYHSPDYFSIGGREAGNNDYVYISLPFNDELTFHYGKTFSDVFEYSDWYAQYFINDIIFIEHHKTSYGENNTVIGIRRTF